MFSRCLFLSFALALHVSGQLTSDGDETLDPVVVLGERLISTPPRATVWDEAQIALLDPLSVDDLLSRDPAFSLFRRQNSRFGNPTSSGVSLRNSGATAASRSLVLLDGIPQNDPFGGWVNWARYQPESLESARISPTAGSVLWGNLSAVGSVQMTSREIVSDRLFIKARGSSYGTVSGLIIAESAGESVDLRVTSFTSHSDGFHVIPRGQRGSIDEPLELDTYGVDAQVRWRAADGITVDGRLSYYDEIRSNGTGLTGNSTEAYDASLRVTGERGDISWQLLGYLQDRQFTSQFSSAADDRMSERPALDQFDVPGQGVGGGLTVEWQPDAPFVVQGGIDMRFLSGETNEDAGFVNGSFVRRRQAGGDQDQVGAFIAGSYKISAQQTIGVSARVDRWSINDGTRRETSLRSGATLRDDELDDRTGYEPSFALLWESEIAGGVVLDAAVGSSFRLPNLNELYRPFRVRSDVTEANPELDPERFFTVEAGVTVDVSDATQLRLGIFQHRIDDVIANVPVTDPAAIAQIFGTLPAGGTGAQRQNVDEARVRGVELGIDHAVNDRLDIRGRAIWSQSEFTESSAQPLLGGESFPQAPQFQFNVAADYALTDAVMLSLGADYSSRAFDDALGERSLDAYWNVRVGAAWRVTESMVVRAQVENVFDEDIITGVASTGLVSEGQQRFISIGVEMEF